MNYGYSHNDNKFQTKDFTRTFNNLNKININVNNLNENNSNLSSTKNFFQLKLRQGNTSDSPIILRNSNNPSNKNLNSISLLKSEKNNSENFDNHKNKLNPIHQINTRSFSFNNINTKFDDKSKITNAGVNNLNFGYNSIKSTQNFNNFDNLDQYEKQTLGFTFSKRTNESGSNNNLKFNNAYSLNIINNVNFKDYLSPKNKNLELNQINSANSTKGRFFIENSERNFFNTTTHKELNDGSNSKRNIENTNSNVKKSSDKISNENSGLKIPKNFLKFNSHLFADVNNINKKSLDNLKTSNNFAYELKGSSARDLQLKTIFSSSMAMNKNELRDYKQSSKSNNLQVSDKALRLRSLYSNPLKINIQDSLCLTSILQNNIHLSRASIVNKLEEINKETQDKIKNEINSTTKTSLFEKNNDLHKNHPFNTSNLQHSRKKTLSPDKIIIVKNHIIELSSKNSELEHSTEKREAHSDNEAKNSFTGKKQNDAIDPIEKDFKYKIKSKTSYGNLKNSISARNVLSNKNSSLFKSDYSELNKDEVTTLNINPNNIFDKENFEIKITRSKHSSGKSRQSNRNKGLLPQKNCNSRVSPNRISNNNANDNKSNNFNKIKFQSREKENKEEYEKTLNSNFNFDKQQLHLNNIIVITHKKSNLIGFGQSHANFDFEKNAMVKSFASKSVAGMNFNGSRKINQDVYLTKNYVLGHKNFLIFGVYDGHGTHGHFISNFVKNYIANYFTKTELYKENKNDANRNNNSAHLTLQEMYEVLSLNKNSIIKKVYKEANKQLKFTKYEISFSGTTANTIIIVGNKLINFNCGDSRSMLVIEHLNKEGKEMYLEALQLSTDHKPNNEEENVRIEKCGGKVEKYIENGRRIGPYRVWKKGEKYPGLAMSRSIGDLIASKIGIICTPDVFEYELNERSRCAVIASDGVWEFLTNKQVLDIAMRFYQLNDPDAAANAIVEESNKCWRREDTVVDDITCIVIYFDKNNLSKING